MNNNKLNILFLASWYPNKEALHAGNFIQKHAVAINKLCNVTVLHVVAKKQAEKYIVTVNKENGIKELIVYYQQKQTILSKKNAFLAAYKHGFKQLNTQFNLVHLNVCYKAGLFALYLKKQYNLNYILTEHWTAFLPITPVKFNLIEKSVIKKIINNASWVCPVSNNLLNEIDKQFDVKKTATVIPNVVNTNVFTLNKKGNCITESFKFLHVSNLKENHKNISGILTAIKALSEVRSDFKFTIVGDGDFMYYKKQAKILAIPKQIINIEGEKSTDEIAQLMQNNNAFVLFSNYENLPCVIAEAHVSGLPVIATDVGGINEMIDASNGVLIEKNNINQLVKELNNIIDHFNKYKPKEIAKKACNTYSYENVAEKYLEVYQRVISTK